MIPANENVYFMWDTLATGYLGASQFMTLREARTEAVPAGSSAGRIKEVTEGGKLVRVADTVECDRISELSFRVISTVSNVF